MKAASFGWAGFAILVTLSAQPARAAYGYAWIYLSSGAMGSASGGAITEVEDYEYWEYGFQAVVNGQMTQDGSIIGMDRNQGYEAYYAEVDFTGWVAGGCSLFTIWGKYSISIDEGSEEEFGEDPEPYGGYACGAGGGGGGGGGGCTPSISSIKVNGQATNTLIVGTTGNLEIDGDCLYGVSQVQVDGSGIQVTGPTGTATQVNASYQADSSTSTGNRGLTVTAQNGTTSPSNLFAIQITVKEVSYFDNLGLAKDTASGLIAVSNPVWKATNTQDANDAVAYVQGSTMRVGVNFSANPAPLFAVPGVRIEGAISGLGKFTADNVTIPLASETGAINVTADTASPSTTKFYNPYYGAMVVNWAISANGSQCSSNCAAAGSSTNKVYVTPASPYRDPSDSRALPSPIPLTVMHLAVSNDGASTPAQAFQNTWALFAGPSNIFTWDLRPLFYYRNQPDPIGFSPNSASGGLDLLTSSSGSGECETFADLLRWSLAVNGIATNFVTVSAVDETEFFINNWAFSTPASYGDPSQPGYQPVWQWKMTMNSAAWSMSDYMVPHQPADLYVDLWSLPGIPGQGGATPSEKMFDHHFIVKADSTIASIVGGPYFDPSYGVTYANAADFQTKAIAGYATRLFGDPGGQFHARKPGSGVNIALVP